MELKSHLIVILSLAVYSIVLVIVVLRNNRQMRSQHACSDVSGPLAQTIAHMVDNSQEKSALLKAIEMSQFSSIRIVVFDPDQNVLADTVERGLVRPSFKSPDQQSILDEVSNGGKTSVSNRDNATKLSRLDSVKTKAGLLVVTEASVK